MPRVERDAEVTLVVLVYRSLAWLQWCMDGVDESVNDARYRWHVVSNDGTEEVRNDPRISLDWRNENPKAFYIENVYRAWNEGVVTAPTQKVIMLNSDMFPFHHWIDELLEAKARNRRAVPTSQLIESGRLPSGIPEHVENHGMTPDEFDRRGFYNHAARIAERHVHGRGRLFMPILVDRQEFIDVGKYPEGNPPGTTGDKDLIRRYGEAGFKHVTALGSVVYHVQLGEQNWP